MQLTIQVRNAKLVGRGLANIRAEVPRISERTIKKGADAIVRRMRAYPSAPAGSRYIRTYKLKNAWRVARSVTGYTVSADPIGRNGTRYGPYVVGYADGTGQASVHAGRWPLLRDVSEQEVEKLPPMVADQISMVVRKEGLA